MCVRIVLADGDASPIHELCEHVFNAMALAIELGVVGKRDLSVLSSRDAGHDALGMKGLTVPVTVVAAVSDEFPGRSQDTQRQRGALLITHLASGKQ